LGAKFAEFGGFEMPVEYSVRGGVLAEHRAVREAAGIFDVSHLGTFLVEGSGAAAWLNTRLSNDLNRISPGQAQYTLLLNESGGVVDDMIAYLFSPEKVMVIPNAANSDEVIRRLRTGAPDDLVWTDRHTADAILAVQGPSSPGILAEAGLPTDMDYMHFRVADLDLGGNTPSDKVGHGDLNVGRGQNELACSAETKEEIEARSAEHGSCGSPVTMTVCRTGYTGERGYEIVVPAQYAVPLWDLLTSVGSLQPCGLGARDTLRTEMGYPLHGNDLSQSISPVEARLSWAVGWKKDHFDGDEAVRAQRRDGAPRTLLGIRACGRAIPRHGMVVLDLNGALIGEVTSGTFSPTLKQGIGLVLVPSSFHAGDQVQVEIRGRHELFDLTKPPFVPSHVTDG